MLRQVTMVAKFLDDNNRLRLSNDDCNSNENGKKNLDRFILAKQLHVHHASFVHFLAIAVQLQHETS